MKFRLTTGGENWRQEATNHMTAAIEAFKRRPPKHPGHLTEVQDIGRKLPPFYVSSKKALQLAGYKVTATDGDTAGE